jgi:predicted nucleic acid-binding protein
VKRVLDADVLIGALDGSDAHHAEARSLLTAWHRRDQVLISVAHHSHRSTGRWSARRPPRGSHSTRSRAAPTFFVTWLKPRPSIRIVNLADAVAVKANCFPCGGQASPETRDRESALAAAAIRARPSP